MRGPIIDDMRSLLLALRIRTRHPTGVGADLELPAALLAVLRAARHFGQYGFLVHWCSQEQLLRLSATVLRSLVGAFAFLGDLGKVQLQVDTPPLLVLRHAICFISGRRLVLL